MTNRGVASHTGRSRLISDDPLSAEDERRQILARDYRFQVALRAALEKGSETWTGCRGTMNKAEAARIVSSE